MSAAPPLTEPPVRATPLPFCRPELTAEEIAAVVRVLESGWLTTGPECAAFERELADYLAVPHAAALNSCTAALHLGLLALGIGPGDAVLTSPFTFCASVNVILHVGAIPILADVDPLTGCLDPARLPNPATLPHLKALLPVHYAGNASDLVSLRAWAPGVPVLSDCAHALETRSGGQTLAELSDLAAYSFYATKNLTTGEGGALASHDPSCDARIRTLRLHGMSADAHRRYEPGAKPVYDVAEPGFKYNLTDPAAALGRLQLAALEARWQIRADWVRQYQETFQPLVDAEVLRFLIPEPMATEAPDRCAFHLCPIAITPERWTIDRDALVAALQAEGIGVSVHFTPVHEFSFYAKMFGWRPEEFPVAHQLGKTCLSLPLHAALRAADVADVCEAFARCWRRYRR